MSATRAVVITFMIYIYTVYITIIHTSGKTIPTNFALVPPEPPPLPHHSSYVGTTYFIVILVLYSKNTFV